MKSSIEESGQKEEDKPKFPVLKKWKSHGIIVLFFGENDGACVHSGSSDRQLGEMGPWVNCSDPAWKDFKGKVILEN